MRRCSLRDCSFTGQETVERQRLSFGTAGYGDIWYPDVPAGGAPYREGYWAWVEPWGWSWIDEEAWVLPRSITAAGA
jgi:hypothetical protein